VRDRLTLILMIDALGYHQAGEMSFLPELERPRAPVRSVLGYSSAAIPTILTGQLPQSHGHFSMYRRAGPRRGVFRGIQPWINLACRTIGPRWFLRQWIARYLRARGVTGYFSLYQIPLPWLGHFDLCQKRDVYAPRAFDGLSGLADELQRRGDFRLWSWRVPEERLFPELEEEIDRGEKRVLFAYTPELDSVMHVAGPESAATMTSLRGYERRIRVLMERARARYGEVRVFLFGDHGMAPVQHRHDLWGPLQSMNLRLPRDLLYFLDSTMARFWFRTDQARRQVDEYLSGLAYGRVLSEEELSKLGASFKDADYGERIFLLHEKAILLPSFMSDQPVKGMHGYHPDAPHSFTTLVTNVHDRPYPENLIELHALLRAEILETAP
jgi:hypothetical protein